MIYSSKKLLITMITITALIGGFFNPYISINSLNDNEIHSSNEDVIEIISIESLDLEGERIEIVNKSNHSVNLEGWSIHSVTGGQKYVFPDYPLEPNEIVCVCSGNGNGDLRWSPKFIWNNEGDSAELKDNLGNLVDIEPSQRPTDSIGFLNKDEMKLAVGESENLKVRIIAYTSRTDISSEMLVWESTDETVAVVNKGVVKGINEGEATITVKTSFGELVDRCSIEIVVIAVSKTHLNKDELQLTEGEIETLAIKIEPLNATNQAVTAKSTNTNVATVKDPVMNGEGEGTVEITGLRKGTAEIKITTVDGSHPDICTVIVIPKEIIVSSLEFDEETIEIVEGKIETLAIKIEPSNATNQAVTAKSTNTNVATVKDPVMNGEGEGIVEITGVRKGIAEITVTTEDGKQSKPCEVKVKRNWIILFMLVIGVVVILAVNYLMAYHVVKKIKKDRNRHILEMFIIFFSLLLFYIGYLIAQYFGTDVMVWLAVVTALYAALIVIYHSALHDTESNEKWEKSN